MVGYISKSSVRIKHRVKGLHIASCLKIKFIRLIKQQHDKAGAAMAKI